MIHALKILIFQLIYLVKTDHASKHSWMHSNTYFNTVRISAIFIISNLKFDYVIFVILSDYCVKRKKI